MHLYVKLRVECNAINYNWYPDQKISSNFTNIFSLPSLFSSFLTKFLARLINKSQEFRGVEVNDVQSSVVVESPIGSPLANRLRRQGSILLFKKFCCIISIMKPTLDHYYYYYYYHHYYYDYYYDYQHYYYCYHIGITIVIIIIIIITHYYCRLLLSLSSLLLLLKTRSF